MQRRNAPTGDRSPPSPAVWNQICGCILVSENGVKIECIVGQAGGCRRVIKCLPNLDPSHRFFRAVITSHLSAQILVLNFQASDICSCEHDNAIPNVFRQAETATASSPASTGAKFMAETAHRLKTILERIHEDTEQALS